jgi:hypothetical protein
MHLFEKDAREREMKPFYAELKVHFKFYDVLLAFMMFAKENVQHCTVGGQLPTISGYTERTWIIAEDFCVSKDHTMFFL